MSLQNRIENLEKRTNIGREPRWTVLCPGKANITDGDIELAKAAYKERFPNWKLEQDIILPVGYPADSPVVEMLERMRSGEWPPKE